jgi:hypothetical protein
METPLHPVSLRMTFAEKAKLERDAAGMSLSSYIRWRLFDPDDMPPHSRGKHPVGDHKALAQLLALLGASRLSSNVNQLARAVNTGSLPVTPDTRTGHSGCRAGYCRNAGHYCFMPLIWIAPHDPEGFPA